MYYGEYIAIAERSGKVSVVDMRIAGYPGDLSGLSASMGQHNSGSAWERGNKRVV